MITIRFFQKLSLGIALSLIIVSCDKSRTYLSILNQNTDYYFQLAKSCNELLQNTNYTSLPVIIRGNDPRLPISLKELHATKIAVNKHFIVGTNEVSKVAIVFGEGRPDYIVAWTHADYGNGYRPWELSVAGEEVGKIVFSTTNLSIFDTKGR